MKQLIGQANSSPSKEFIHLTACSLNLIKKAMDVCFVWEKKTVAFFRRLKNNQTQFVKKNKTRKLENDHEFV